MKKLLLITAGFYISQMLYAQTPVAYYPFSGNANDAFGIYNGTVSGATLTTDRFGNASSAYSFDGVDDNISINNNPVFNFTNYTISVWFKYNGAGTAGKSIWSLVSKNSNGNGFDDAFHIWVNATDKTTGGRVGNGNSEFYVGNTPAVDNGQWHHSALVFDNANDSVRLYLDGVFISAVANSSNPFNNGGNIKIGYWEAYNNFFNGAIDDVKIYNTALTASDILLLFNNTEVCNGIDDDEDGLIDEVCIPIVSITGKNIDEGNSDTSSLKLTVTLSNDYESTVSVKYKTANKTATAGSDYVALNKTLKFNPGQTSKKITLQVLGDVTVEPNEDFYVILSSPVNATLGAADTATVRIKNDDVAAAVVSATSDAAAVSSMAVKLSPNPAKNILTITGLRAEKSSIEITDMQGRAVAKENTTGSIATVNIANLVPGMYMLKYFDGSSYKTVKFIKE